jgi:hypothetical protein
VTWSAEGLVATRLGRRYGDLVALERLDLTVGPCIRTTEPITPN